MSRAYNVIDADGHILEPLTLWKITSTRSSATRRHS